MKTENQSSAKDPKTGKPIPTAAPPGDSVLLELSNNQKVVEQKHKSAVDHWIEETAAEDNNGGG